MESGVSSASIIALVFVPKPGSTLDPVSHRGLMDIVANLIGFRRARREDERKIFDRFAVAVMQ